MLFSASYLQPSFVNRCDYWHFQNHTDPPLLVLIRKDFGTLSNPNASLFNAQCWCVEGNVASNNRGRIDSLGFVEVGAAAKDEHPGKICRLLDH